MPFLLYIAALMKRKKEKSIQKKSFPEVTASRVKPEKQEGLHLVRKKETIRGKNKQRKKTWWNVTPSHWICFSRWKPVFQDTIFINMFYLSCFTIRTAGCHFPEKGKSTQTQTGAFQKIAIGRAAAAGIWDFLKPSRLQERQKDMWPKVLWLSIRDFHQYHQASVI